MGRPTNKSVARNSETDLSRLVWSNIRKYMYLRGITDEQVAMAFGFADVQPIRNRDKKPGMISIEELQNFCVILDIQPEKLFSE